MQKLFELRRVFHKIAAGQSACRQQTAMIICWVDVLLAKLGDAALVMTRIFAGLDERENVSEVFEIHRRQLSLYAALQLPGEFNRSLFATSAPTTLQKGGFRSLGLSLRTMPLLLQFVWLYV